MRAGMEIVKLYFPGRIFASVEEKPPKVKVRAPSVIKALLALPNYTHAEQTELEQRVERLKELEAYMSEWETMSEEPDLHLATDALGVTVKVEDQGLRDSDYHAYALICLKNAQKRLREEALTLHPDKQTGHFASLKQRCEEAMKFLNNVFDVIKQAFSAHLVPEVEGVEIYFALSRTDAPKLLVKWAKQHTLETIFQWKDGAGYVEWTLPPSVDLCVFTFDKHPNLFKSAEVHVTLHHVGIDGSQCDMTSAKTRRDVEVPLHIRLAGQKVEVQKELERLRGMKRKGDRSDDRYTKRTRYTSAPWRAGNEKKCDQASWTSNCWHGSWQADHGWNSKASNDEWWKVYDKDEGKWGWPTKRSRRW